MLRNLLFAFLAAFGVSAVLGESPSLTNITATNPDLSILNTALGLTGLDDLLEFPNCHGIRCGRLRLFTVFAPTDAAFQALPDGVLTALTENPEFLTHLSYILSYHVTLGEILAADIEDGGDFRTLIGQKVNTTVNATGVFLNDDAQVVAADVEASNGVAHVIDQVLLPSFMLDDIIGIAEKKGDFTTLLTAIETAGLTSALQGAGPFTLFAPTDDAFAKLGDAVIADLLGNVTALTDILTYHVVPGQIITFSELEAGTVTTLQGQDISIGYSGYWFFRYPTLNGDVTFKGFDILASNGVIHAISDVLLPPGAEPPVPTITEIAGATDDLSTLVAALEATGLNETLQTSAGPLTVFAPTNAAFEKLGSDTINSLLADPTTLSDILLYHVVDGGVRQDDLSDGPVTTLNGKDVDVHVRGWWFWTRYFLNGDTRITDFDIEASNGVIHLIDEVLTPPSDIVTVATSGGFNTLVAALEATGLNETLANEPGPFTVFAPTDEAFAKLDPDTLNNLLANPDQLTPILLYHVVSGSITRGDLEAGDVPTLLEGQSITVNPRRCFFFFCSRVTLNDDVDFEDFDITASNGIIHSIDTVLLPPSV